MGGKGNDRCSGQVSLPFVFSDLARGFKASHDWHLHIHQNDIVPTLFDSFHGLQTVADNGDVMLVLLQDLDGQFLINVVVFGEKNVKRPGIVGGNRGGASFQRGEHAISDIDWLARGGHVGTDTEIQRRLQANADQRTNQNNRNILEVIKRAQQPGRYHGIHDDDIVSVARLLAGWVLDLGRRNVVLVADHQWFQVDRSEHLQQIIGLDAILTLVDKEHPVILVRHEL